MIIFQILLIPLVLFLMLGVVFGISAMGVSSTHISTQSDFFGNDVEEFDQSHDVSPALPISF